MMQKRQAFGSASEQEPSSIDYWQVLNAAATALQRAVQAEKAVYEAFREQMTALGLQGSINWLDNSNTYLTIAAVVFSPRIMRILRRFEKMAGQMAVGFQFSTALLAPYLEQVENGSAVFLPDNSPLLQAIMTERARPFLRQFMAVFGGIPGMLAPLYIGGQVRGVLYLADQGMVAEDSTAVAALANHLSIAIENARLFQQTRRREEELRVLADNVPGIIYQCANNYTFDMIYLNDAIETLTGYTKEKFLQREISFRDLYHPDDTDLLLPEREVERKGGLFHAIYRIRHRSGVWRWVEEFGKGVFDDQGELLFLEGSITDITERKQAEMLQSALYRIATVANADLGLDQLYPAIHAILGDLMDVHNFYIALVDASSGLLQLPYFVDEMDDYDGQPFDGRGGLTAYVIDTGLPQLLSRMELKRLERLDLVHVIGAMPEVWLGVPLRTQTNVFGAVVVQSYRDAVAYTEREKQLLFFVSGQVAAAIDRKRSEDQLRAMAAEIVKQSQMFEQVLSTTPDQFAVYDRDGRVTFASAALLKALNLSTSEALGQTIAELTFLPPETAARIAQEQEEVFLTGRPFSGEVRVTARNGIGIREIEYILSPIKDETGGVTAVVSAARDMTERNKTKAALHHAQKMESLGILAGGVAHDFNNLLVGMMAQTSLAIAKLPPDSLALRHIEKAIQAAERAAELTNQMLAYSGHGQFTAVPIHLNDLIQDYFHLLHVTASSKVLIELDLDPSLPLIEGDPGQLQQLLLNLVLNSSEAIGECDGIIRLSTAVRPITSKDEAYWQVTNSPLPPGNYVSLVIEDNGEGMDEHTLTRLFEPFFTTRFTGRGLGLAAALGIIRGHDGGLQVTSTPGVGTKFEILFPGHQLETAIEPPTMPMAVAPGMVLVVDDEPAVCDTVIDILEIEQIPALTAVDGETAITIYREHLGKIALVLLDMSLPDMHGKEVFNHLKELDPQVQVILTSGYDEMEAVQHFGNGLLAFLQKPYSLEELIAIVRRHLPPKNDHLPISDS